jgi:hypothetical protein
VAAPREATFARKSSISTNGRHSASSRNSIQPRPQISLFRMKGSALQFSHLPVCKWKSAPYLFQGQSSHVTESCAFSTSDQIVFPREIYLKIEPYNPVILSPMNINPDSHSRTIWKTLGPKGPSGNPRRPL